MLKNPPQQPSRYVALVRFGVRIIILTAFAWLSGVGFGRSFAALSAMSAILCTVMATIRSEPVFPRALNHWDEAVGYAALYFLTVSLNLSSPT